MISRRLIFIFALTTLSGIPLLASIFRFANFTPHEYTANLSMRIGTLDITDRFIIPALDYIDRDYNREYIHFLRLILEDEYGQERIVWHPFASLSHNVMDIYDDSIEMRPVPAWILEK